MVTLTLFWNLDRFGLMALYYYYLITFNVRIEPLGFGRLIIHGFVSLVAPLRSTFILALHGLRGQGFQDATGCSTDPSLS